MENVFDKIRQWRLDRNITGLDAQNTKLSEEAGELASAISHKHPEEIADAIGDCVVVLTNIADIAGLKIEDCIELAYNEIKNRTGKTENGNFIKTSSRKTHHAYIALGENSADEGLSAVYHFSQTMLDTGGYKNIPNIRIVDFADDDKQLSQKLMFWATRTGANLRAYKNDAGEIVYREECPDGYTIA